MMNSLSASPSTDAAPGAPGAQAFWSRSSKDGIGTAYHTGCRLWFTLSRGAISEIYCPTVDTPNTRELHFLVTDGESPTLKVMMRWVLKPGLTSHKLWMVRKSRPAPVSKTRVSAIWTTTRRF